MHSALHHSNVLLQRRVIIEATGYFSPFVAGLVTVALHQRLAASESNIPADFKRLLSHWMVLAVWLQGAVRTRLEHCGILSGARRMCVGREEKRGENG